MAVEFPDSTDDGNAGAIMFGTRLMCDSWRKS